ncbi:winged helix-turn-helix transcriptional regulator [Actinosynnema sp. NPDC059335]|uniref:winged helix-turn-helix transcriptional regulator n=1 Tax=Actinosynnema sp. NPDC059335 TaxID=3346804 RepID=UPI003671B012
MAAKRTYHQYCGLASALDVVGERWTLLIVRELLMGPRRYVDLLADLPALGTNLLAERLKFLVEKGVVEQVDLHGTGSRLAYQLTATGQELRPLVAGLTRWGMRFVGEVSEEDTVRPHWGFLAVEAMLRPEKATDVDECYEFRVDDAVYHIEVRDRVPRAVKGPAEAAAMVATTDATTFVEIGSGRLTPLAAMVTGRLSLVGEADAVLRCCDLLGLEAGVAPAAGRATGRATGRKGRSPVTAARRRA